MNDTKLTPPQIIILVAGGVALIGSFLDVLGASLGGESESSSAWGSGALPVITLPALLLVAAAVILALKTFGNVNLPERLLGFTWQQLYLVAGFWATLEMIGLLLYKLPEGLDVERGIGFWLMLLAAIGTIVGAVMLGQEEGVSTTGTGTAPPTPF